MAKQPKGKLKKLNLSRILPGPQGDPGPIGTAGPRGETGGVGPHGTDGPVGPQGFPGDMGPTGTEGRQGPQGLSGVAGDAGPQGLPGLPPEHRWEGNKLQFKLPDGTWGRATDLTGPGGGHREHGHGGNEQRVTAALLAGNILTLEQKSGGISIPDVTVDLSGISAAPQDLWETIDGDSGSTTANIPTDTLSILGDTGITTSVAGDTLTIDLDPGLAGYLGMSKASWVFSDFMGQVSLLHDDPFRAIGADGGTVIGTTTDHTDHPGIWCISTGTSSIQGRVFILSSTGLGSWMIGVGAGNEIRSTTWLQLGPFLSTAANRYAVRTGFSKATIPNAISEGITFEYQDDENGGRWQAITKVGGVETSTDTGVTVAPEGTWYKMEFIINAAGTSVEFFIDDVSVAVNTTNIPTGSGIQHFHSTHIYSVTGTAARTLYTDAISIYTGVTR